MQLTIGVLLARLLVPGDYGLMAMATVFTSFFAQMADMGIATAIIQRQGLTREEISSFFWLNVTVATVVAVLLAGVSPWVGAACGTPAVVPLLCAVAALVPVNASCVIYDALMQKDLRFAECTKLAMLATSCGGLGAVAAALLGWGVWALVVQQAVVVGLNLAGFVWLTRWCPVRRLARQDLRQVWDFSLHMTGLQLVNFLGRNADKMLIGRFLGPGPVGSYTMAYTLMLFPISNVTGVLAGVLLPTLSAVQDDPKRIGRAYIKVCRYQAFAIFPTMTGLALVAPEAVAVVYGDKWGDAGRVLSVLAWVGVFQPLISLSGTLVVARGFTRWFFGAGLIATTTTTVAFVLGLPWGIMGVAMAYLLSQLLLAFTVVPKLLRKVDVPLPELLQALALPAALTAGMGLAVAGLKAGLHSRGWTASGPILVACVGTGILVYSAGLFWRRAEFWPEIHGLIQGFMQRRRPEL